MKSIPLRQWEAAAYAAGRLTQIRRVVKGNEYWGKHAKRARFVSGVQWRLNGDEPIEKWLGDTHTFIDVYCPYGAPGDRLALREAFALVPVSAYRCSEGVAQTANPDSTNYEAAIYRAGFDCIRGGINWHRSARMPLWAVRHHPVITAVRLERVQEMTEADAIKCGCIDAFARCDISPSGLSINLDARCGGPIREYQDIWNRDNPRTLWASNPWTWVYEIEGNTK